MLTFPARLRLLAPLFVFLLAGCVTGVEYGKIAHVDYVDAPRCAPAIGTPVDAAALPLFVVTSRLPDCRSPDIQLLHHRGDRVRYGRFAAPHAALAADSDEDIRTPVAFQNPADWWRALGAETGRRHGRVLLYVHGYRETFETTAKDAAQIARMTGFDGPVIAYSWPSQGSLTGYVVDETNMYHDVRNFRDFLKALAEQDGMEEIVIVAHSLGARLVIPAIAYVDRTSNRADSSNISNIVLASPDVDRETFERDIGEEVLAARRVARDRRITVYVSLADKALGASRALHGYPRLGSPYCFDPNKADALVAAGLPPHCYPDAIPGLTVIDTTDVSRGTIGHSNFLRSAPVCRDFVAVVAGERTRSERTPTHLDHVFRLIPDPANPKPDDETICNRTPEASEP